MLLVPIAKCCLHPFPGANLFPLHFFVATLRLCVQVVLSVSKVLAGVNMRYQIWVTIKSSCEQTVKKRIVYRQKTKSELDIENDANLSCSVSCRYHGPNTGNMHTVADLYAEIIGVLAQSK